MTAPTPPRQPATLRNDHVRLEPLSPGHAAHLRAAVGDVGKAWYIEHVPTAEGIDEHIAYLTTSSSYIPWAVIDTETERAIGVTCLSAVDEKNKHCEIGYTWISADYWGSNVNPAMKLALLGYVFDHLGFMRVEFRCHSMNMRSRRALEKLGATFEGELRRHRVMRNGTIRNTRIYSILDYEWPTVKYALSARLAKRS